MKRIILTLIVISLISVGVFYIYDRFLITQFSEAIIKEDIPEVVPERFRNNAMMLKKELNENSDAIANYLLQNDVPLEDFNVLIDNIEYYEVEKFMENIKHDKFKNPNQAFDYITQHFELNNFPIENYRDDFVKNYDPQRFTQFLSFFEDNKKQAPMMFPIAKETLKKLLAEEYEKRTDQ